MYVLFLWDIPSLIIYLFIYFTDVTVLGLVGGAPGGRHRASPIHRRRAHLAVCKTLGIEGRGQEALHTSILHQCKSVALKPLQVGAPCSYNTQILQKTHYLRPRALQAMHTLAENAVARGRRASSVTFSRAPRRTRGAPKPRRALPCKNPRARRGPAPQERRRRSPR